VARVEDDFDYVVIGAGSAGCALVRNLSDRTGAKILLLEAGGSDERKEIQDPTKIFTLWGSDVDWKYETVPQEFANNRTIGWPRGRVLGGTSSINGMVYLRGDRLDYDTWGYLGNYGWGFDEVFRTFTALEGSKNGSASGHLMPAVVADQTELCQVFIDACGELGIEYNDNFNSGKLSGAGWNESTIYKGLRQSSYRAFLHPIIDRPTITIETNAIVQKLTVSQSKRIDSLTYIKDGKEHTVSINCELIISAGAVDTPRLLLLSGIGDPQELQALGIAPVVELPEVGRNLVDHILLGVAFGSATKINGRNPFVTESCAFVPSNPGVVGSNIQISFVKEKHYVEGYDAPEHCFTIIPGLVRPQSRGSITLRSSDPSVSPLIDPRYLSETADVDDFVSGIQISREIGKTKAFSTWTTGEAAPGPDCSTDAEIRNYIKSVATTWFHPVGTCRMGIDSRAVVDPELRVQGVANLRIADASIMPTIVSCNTNAASIMIGWKAGELIANSRKS